MWQKATKLPGKASLAKPVFLIKNDNNRTSLVIQWLRHHTSTSGGLDSIPGPTCQATQLKSKKQTPQNMVHSLHFPVSLFSDPNSTSAHHLWVNEDLLLLWPSIKFTGTKPYLFFLYFLLLGGSHLIAPSLFLPNPKYAWIPSFCIY